MVQKKEEKKLTVTAVKYLLDEYLSYTKVLKDASAVGFKPTDDMVAKKKAYWDAFVNGLQRYEGQL